jgi:hypothetical protein
MFPETAKLYRKVSLLLALRATFSIFWWEFCGGQVGGPELLTG